MCRDHRPLPARQKQHRQNDPAGQVDVSTRVEVHVMGDPDRCRDNRHLTNFQKQYRQNELVGQIDISTRLEVCVMGDPSHV